MGGAFQCSDPSCTSRQNNGYFFEINLGNSAQTFTATGRPAVVGKTGSTKCVTDQTGGIFQTPIPDAEAIHRQMFDDINARALQTMFQLIHDRPGELQRIISRLEAPDTPPSAFRQLDGNGDGIVTFTEILNYGGVGSDALSGFLTFTGQRMELGAGGEDVNALPGVTLDMLASPSTSGNIMTFDADVNNGISKLNSDPIAGTPTVQLGGFSDASVRFARSNGSQGVRIEPGVAHFSDTSFFA